jgi:hypothetical protein
MATRMQQRRGTAAQWTSANPILNAGEMGWESDTNKFKIGDGTNHWADIDYFIDQSSTVNPAFGSSITFEGATANDYETTLAVTDPTADRTITLPNATGTVVLADGSGNVTVSGNLTVQGTTTTIDSSTIAVTNSFTFEGSTADDYETTLTVTDPTADRTITLPNVSGTVITTGNLSGTGATAVELGYLAGVTSAIQTQIDTKAPTSTTTTLTGTQTLTNKTLTSPVINTPTGITKTDVGLANVDNTADVNKPISYATQTALDAKRDSAESVTLAATKVIVFEGTTNDEYETTLKVDDPTADREITLPNATGTVVLHDATQTLTNKTITSANNTISVTASTVSDFTEAAQDAIGNSVGTGLSYNDTTGAVSVDTNAIQTRVTDVSDTEIGYLNGVTSGIQTQIDAKAASSHTHAQADITNLTTDLAAKAALSGATFTGAVVLAADPATALGAATKQYVDSLAEGLHIHASVVAATTANIALATAVENGDTLDGVTLATGNRILVKNQSTASENGIYVVAASGAPSRATDFDAPAEIDGGDFVFVTGGTVNDNTGWVQTNIVGTVGTDAIEFNQFAGSGTVTAGTNISVTGNQVSVINNPTFSGVVTASASGVAFSDGTQTKAGVPSITPRVEASDSYNLSTGGLTLRDSIIEINKASATTLTIPTNATTAFPVGTSIDILQVGAGQVTVSGAVGVTLNYTPGNKLRAQWSSATLFKRATDTWVLMGDLSA